MTHRLTEAQSRLLKQLKKSGEHGVDPTEHWSTTVDALVRGGYASVGLVTVQVPRMYLNAKHTP
ncbi:MAG: hypothetical protein H7233_14865 [Pseudorhodobacter sp.]|nr:hypothetical protein [Frankiaceae bacterium]